MIPLDRRAWLLAFLVGMTALALWGLLGEHRVRRSFGGPDEGLIEELLYEFGYSLDDCLLVVEGEDLFRPVAVASARRVVAAVEGVDGVADVLSLDDVPARPPLPASVLPRDGASAKSFVEARERALAHPWIGQQLASLDGTTWVLPVLLDVQRHEERLAAGEEVDRVAELRAAVASVALPAGMRAELTGTLVMAHDTQETFDREQLLYHGAAYVLAAVLATLMFRGFVGVVLAGGGPILGVLWTFGWVELLGLELSSLARILMPIMIMMIGFTDSVHVLVHLRRARSEGQSPREATRSALRRLFQPCFLTTLTTGLGFASLLVARSELVRNFGLACALGVTLTFLSVMSFLPYFASSALGRHLRERERNVITQSFTPLGTRLFGLVLRYARTVTALGCLLTAAALVHGAGIETESRVAADIPESSPATRALARIDQSFGGSVPFKVVVSWDAEREGEAGGILAAVRAARAAVEAEEDRSDPFDLTDVVGLLAGDSAEPEAALATLALLPESLRERLWRPEVRAASIDLLLPDRGTRYFEPMFLRLEERMGALREDFPGFDFQLAGQAVLSGRIYGQFTEDLMHSLLLAGVTIFLVMTIAFRSLRLGLISVLPNVFPLAMTASALVLFGLPMAGATAFVMSLGIAVDDTIHFLTRFRHEYAKDEDLEEAVRRTVVRVGKALVMTTVVLVVGYSSVLTSDFPRNRLFAAMVCFTLAAALLCDVVLLPAMLKTFGYRHRTRGLPVIGGRGS